MARGDHLTKIDPEIIKAVREEGTKPCQWCGEVPRNSVLAKRYDISESQVSRIISGQTRKGVR